MEARPAIETLGDLPAGFGGVDDDAVIPLTRTSEQRVAQVAPALSDHRNIDLAFLAAQREFEEIVKDKSGTVDGRAYGYASLHNVIDTLRPVVNRHGMTLTHPTAFKDIAGRAWLIVTATLTHAASGQTKTAEWPVAAGLVHPQQLAALNTMARRQATLSLLGAAPEESDVDAADAPGAGSSPPSSTQASSPAPGVDNPEEAAEVAAALAPTAPEVAADVLKHLDARNLIDAALNKVATEADLDALMNGDLWSDLPRRDRSTFEDKIEVIREQIKAGDGKRAPPQSRRAFMAAKSAVAPPAPTPDPPNVIGDALAVDDPNADAKLFARLSLSLQKAKGKAALDAWARNLDDATLAKLNALQRESLEQEYKRRAGKKTGG